MVFFFAGWLGLMRFPGALSRLHALSKADNLGLGLVILGLLPQATWPFGGLKLIALWLVAVVVGGASSQLLAGAIAARIGAEDNSDDAESKGGLVAVDAPTGSARDPKVPR